MNKLISNTAELFQTQFGWSWKDIDQDNNIIVFTDYEDQEYAVEIEVRNTGWRPDGSFKYNTLLFEYNKNLSSNFFISI